MAQIVRYNLLHVLRCCVVLVLFCIGTLQVQLVPFCMIWYISRSSWYHFALVLCMSSWCQFVLVHCMSSWYHFALRGTSACPAGTILCWYISRSSWYHFALVHFQVQLVPFCTGTFPGPAGTILCWYIAYPVGIILHYLVHLHILLVPTWFISRFSWYHFTLVHCIFSWYHFVLVYILHVQLVPFWTGILHVQLVPFWTGILRVQLIPFCIGTLHVQMVPFALVHWNALWWYHFARLGTLECNIQCSSMLFFNFTYYR